MRTEQRTSANPPSELSRRNRNTDDDLHVAVQHRDRRDDLLDPQPGDAPSTTSPLDCTTHATPTGIDVDRRKRPHLQGAPGTFTVFRVLDAAVRTGRLHGRLGLTDARG
ncbi:DUF5990 family protein [Streptomyces aquilus]|uniref:DUF5990 family protein n=1 Tax=Streptomyces aquilus TaxID=2548456 RepID=UPI0024493853|nr:DUF5990 family protein [Streptomyces aquilus]